MNMKDTFKYSPTYGVVCLIDALGAKNFNDDETINFLKSRAVIREALNDKGADQVDRLSIKPPKIALFNDTIIIAIECKPNGEEEKLSLTAMAIIVRKLISDGITRGVWFRGAIGVGKFFADLKENTIIGEAVSDAANWYESTNFIGCVLTPRAAFVRKKHLVKDEPSAKSVYIPYLASTKDGDKEMLCVNWPLAFHYSFLRPSDCGEGKELQYLYGKFGGHFFPKCADDKYHNTIKFFKHSFGRMKEKPKEASA